MQCRICGGELTYRWTTRVLGGRYPAEYHECRACHALQVPNPTWLDEAYAASNLATQADAGRFCRTFSAYAYLTALIDAGACPPRPRILDFGGGYGLLTQMLVNGGYDAWTTDPYEPAQLFATDRRVDNPDAQPPESFDLIISLEVFEHLLEPMAVARSLRRLLKPAGTLVLSTGIYRPGAHGPDWPYLSPETGQHVTLWSQPALEHLAAQCGFASLGHYPGAEGFLIVLSPLSPEQLAGVLRQAMDLLARPDHAHRITRGWDLRTGGWVKPTPRPQVHAIHAAG